MERRKATQPLHLPSCGSTFTNPPNDHAGRLIEAAGLKGFQIGEAQISPKHANFIVNLGKATSDDIRAVLEHAKQEVFRQFGIPSIKRFILWETGHIGHPKNIVTPRSTKGVE